MSTAFKYFYEEPVSAKYEEGVDIWPLACLMVFAVSGQLPFGAQACGVAILRGLLERMGEPPAALVARNRWNLLRSEVGVRLVAAHPRRGGMSPGRRLEHAWADRVFQWAANSRPNAMDFVREAEAVCAEGSAKKCTVCNDLHAPSGIPSRTCFLCHAFPRLGFRRQLVYFAQIFEPDLILQVPAPSHLLKPHT